jgi:competence ComEA-like helix-hairpin-helix protein
MKERATAQSSLHPWKILCSGLLFVFSLAAVADDLPLSETNLENLSAEEYFNAGAQVVGQVCTICHDIGVATSTRMTPGQWEFVVSDMIARGASATPEQKEFISRFMAWAMGRVSVNSAPASDLALVIGIPDSQAEAIVAYREEHGDFADLESLKQVPGVSSAMLDQQAAGLLFD